VLLRWRRAETGRRERERERGDESRLLLVATVSFALGAEPSEAGRAGYLYFISNKQEGKVGC
jgi:hypothetical protein